MIAREVSCLVGLLSSSWSLPSPSPSCERNQPRHSHETCYCDDRQIIGSSPGEDERRHRNAKHREWQVEQIRQTIGAAEAFRSEGFGQGVTVHGKNARAIETNDAH